MGEPIAEVGYLAGICGHDGTNWEKVLIDASKRLVVAIASAIAQECQNYGWDGDSWEKLQVDANKYLKVTLPIEEALGARAYHYTGSDWVRSNLLWGYHDKWDENMGGAATGTTYSKTTGVVPAGEVWVLQAISLANNSRNGTTVYLHIYRASGGIITLNYAATLAQFVPLLANGNFTLSAGDYAAVYMASTQSGDSMVGGISGYKMDIAM